jgi:glycosyltransferase involved in cell wall biosynthesis
MAQTLTYPVAAWVQPGVERVRVMQFVPELCIGGAESMAASLACSLDSKRFDVLVVALRSLNSRLEHALAESRIRFVSLERRHRIDPRPIIRLRNLISGFRPDILHTHLGVWQYALPSLLTRRFGEAIHTVHKIADRDRGLSRWFLKTAFGLGVKPVSISREVLLSLRRVYGIKSTPFIPNGIDVSDYHRNLKSRREWRTTRGFAEEDVLFLCVAGLREVKNHQLLIEAFARLPGRCRLVLLGDGPLRSRLVVQANRLGVGERIQFLGETDAVASALNASDVFVLGSVSEAHPLSVMEAMAAGLPCVCTAVGGILDLITPEVNGILVPTQDPVAMSTAMLDLSANVERRSRLGRRASATAAALFGLDRMVGAYSDLYEVLIRQGRKVPRSI